MKLNKMTLHGITFCVIFTLCAAISGCSQDDDNSKDPVDKLPPATQTGENTIGCLVNGEALLPKGISPTGNRQCFYQLVDGEYYFGLSFFNKNGDTIKSLNIALLKTKIIDGKTFPLNKNIIDNGDYAGGGRV